MRHDDQRRRGRRRGLLQRVRRGLVEVPRQIADFMAAQLADDFVRVLSTGWLSLDLRHVHVLKASQVVEMRDYRHCRRTGSPRVVSVPALP
jgi:hypothetical protein